MKTRDKDRSPHDQNAETEIGSSPLRMENIWRWKAGQPGIEVPDQLAEEEPLEIRVQGRSVAVTMRSSGHDRELAAGFLLTEGIVRKPEEIIAIRHCRVGESAYHGNTLNAYLVPSVEVDWDRLTRHVFSTSSCGLCGKTSIDAIHQSISPLVSEVRTVLPALRSLPEALNRQQTVFHQTGGLHAAGLFDLEGRLLVIREDIGRHNAVDKVIGYRLLTRKWPIDRQVLMVSGRASFEIMQKALAARIPIVAAVSAPSNLAVEFARTSGQTLIAFLRGSSFNVYAHPERIEGWPGPWKEKPVPPNPGDVRQ